MNCLICENSLVVKKFNTENNDLMFCFNCNLHSVNLDSKSKIENMKNKYQSEFWLDSNYNTQELLNSNFSSKKGLDYLLAQESMFEYYKQFLKPKIKILEIGVGTGVHLLAFDKMGFDVTGIEPDHINAKLINNKLIHGTCIPGYFEDIKFQTKFDIIFLYHVVEHLENPINILETCKKLLNSSGFIIIAVPDCENQVTLTQSINNPYHLWHFSKKSFEKLCNKLDYKIIQIDSFARLPTNQRRFHKILRKIKLKSLSKKFFSFYPLIYTKKNNGYEIRLIIKKNK